MTVKQLSDSKVAPPWRYGGVEAKIFPLAQINLKLIVSFLREDSVCTPLEIALCGDKISVFKKLWTLESSEMMVGGGGVKLKVRFLTLLLEVRRF